MRGLKGKGVLVTGASRGIGEAAARRFLEEGCRVFICARGGEGLEQALAGLRALGEVGGTACDVADPGDVERLVGEAEAFLEGIDVLANNAGVAWQEPFLDITLEHWDQVLDINLRGMFLVAQAVVRRMTARGRGGAIVNMSSTNAVEGEVGYTHYNASKGAINQLTRTMAVELAAYGIRVNALCPGKIRTDLQRDAEEAAYTARYEQERIPLGRSGTVEEVAAAYAFLASDEATFITGEMLVIDGGQLAM
ncbi:MAG TPA: SDR family oxidoreductase [Actinomycetota bacterium]|nr:SDR family oxidoreductase [Actinomycetota bacterium]